MNYFGIDEDIIWDVVSVRIPELMRQLEHALDNMTD